MKSKVAPGLLTKAKPRFETNCSTLGILENPLSGTLITSGHNSQYAVAFRWKKIDRSCDAHLIIANSYLKEKVIPLPSESRGITQLMPDGFYHWRLRLKSPNQKISESENFMLEISEHKPIHNFIVLLESSKNNESPSDKTQTPQTE
jgi:hypothetical protein